MKIITNEEIKVILGISDSSQDALVEIYNEMATSMLASVLGISEFGIHTIENETVRVDNQYFLCLQEFPVIVSSGITLKCPVTGSEISTSNTYELEHDAIRRLRILDSSGKPQWLGYSEVLADYTAGFTTQDTIKVLSNTDLAGKEINVINAGSVSTWKFVSSTPAADEIQVGATTNDTAANIATKLSGQALLDTVALPLGTSVSLLSATVLQLEINNATIPQELKMAVALIVRGSISQRSIKDGVSEIKIDDKTLKFSGVSDKETFLTIVSKYISSFKIADFIPV